MGVSKVMRSTGETIMDISGDTVTADSLLAGYTAHGADGNLINGTAAMPYNVNLLDNADWFAYIINQRGSTTYSQGGQYGFDRWQIYNTAAIVDGAVQMGAYCALRQLMEIPRNVLINRDYTVAIDIDGTVYSEHVNLTSAGVSTSIGGVDVTFGFLSGEYVICGKTETSVPYITFDNNSESVINVRRVWLELGSVCHMETTPPRSYAESFSVCRRYLVPIVRGATFPALIQGNLKQLEVHIPLNCRILPQFDSNTVNINAFRADGVKANVSCTIANAFDYKPNVAYTLTSATDMSTATYRAVSACFLENHFLIAEL